MRCGDALDLLMAVSGFSFKDAAQSVDRICGDVKRCESKPALGDERRVELLNSLYSQCKPATKDDLTGIYLQARGFEWIPNDLHFAGLAERRTEQRIRLWWRWFVMSQERLQLCTGLTWRGARKLL